MKTAFYKNYFTFNSDSAEKQQSMMNDVMTRYKRAISYTNYFHKQLNYCIY